MKRIEVHVSEVDMVREELRAAGKKIGRYRRWIKRWLREGTGTNIMGEQCPDAEVPVDELHDALAGKPVPRNVQA